MNARATLSNCPMTLEPRDAERLAEAFAMASAAHAGQVDKGGFPYIWHPVRVAHIVAKRGFGIDEQIVAMLHDVIEDADVEPELVEAVFGPIVARAVLDVTRRADEPYDAFIERVYSAGPIARAVKLADLADNIDPYRPAFRNEDFATRGKRQARYFRALHYLQTGKYWGK